MQSIQDAFINALLADAAYVDINPILDLSEQLSSRMTLQLAQLIEDNFTVATSIFTPDNVIDGAGFDAVVWRGKPGTSYAGKLYVSMRGTEGIADFVTDANLALFGDAAKQTATMVNWWLRETTPMNQMAAQIQWNLLTGSFFTAAGAPGTGRITASDLSGGILVVGHSLGGYLASTFTRLLGTQANVLQTSTFNSAGFAPNSANIFNALQALVGLALGRPTFPGPGDTSQLNYFAQHGLNLTTNTFWFSQVGQRVELFNEESVSQIPNHYMYKLTDALALGAAMQKLDPTLTLGRVNSLFEAGSNAVAGALEGALGGLRRLLLDPYAAALPVGDVSDSAVSRATYHMSLKLLQDSPAFASIAGRVRIDLSAKDLRAKARNDFSAMASLITLSPATLTATSSANQLLIDGVLQSVWGQTYTSWQADRSMSLVDRQAGKEVFTDQWIADRAVLLEAIVSLNIKNSTGVAYSNSISWSP